MIRCALTIIACSVLVTPAGAAESTANESRSRAARFFADGLEPALVELRRGAQLLALCATRHRSACSREQRTLSANNQTVALLDELTLFPQRLAADAGAREWRAAELREAISATRARLVRAAADYDLLLIARYGAALTTCPDEIDVTKYRDSLETLTSVDLRDFQALHAADYDAARQRIAAAEATAVDSLRAMPPDECRAIFTLGQLLMEMIEAKLEPWTRESRLLANVDREFDFDAAREPQPDPTPTREVATSIAGNFVMQVATELQLQAFPETAPRIKAIADGEATVP